MKESILLLLLVMTSALNAQVKTNDVWPCSSQSDFTIVERNNDGTIKSVRYAATDDGRPASADEFFSTTLKKRKVDNFILVKSNDADNGMHFDSFQQYYQGVRVDDGFYCFSYKNGRMKRARGHYVNVVEVNPVPIITEEGAIKLYASYFGIKKSDIIKSYVDLMIKEIPNEEGKASVTALTYRVSLYTKIIEGGYVGFIDAHTGKLLYKEKAYVDYSTTGQIWTYYNSNTNPKYAITDYHDNNYYLQDMSHWSGIITIHGNSSYFTDADNMWTQTEMAPYGIALDVHWTMQKIYEFISSGWSHNSYDGSGHQIVSLIYDSSLAAYSDTYDCFAFGISLGDAIHGPYGSVDVIGHEYGHALLYKSTSLTGEAAIHEGLADIWGIIFEKNITSSADYWKTGEQIMINGNSCERNFQNPSDATAHTQISSTYGYGAFNSTDPHIKGGLLPYWFYLLVNGGNGTNGANNSYQLLPIGFYLAEHLFIYTALHTNYLYGNLSFQDVANAFIDAAEENYNGFYAEQVQNAFYAVGLAFEPQHIYMQSYAPGSATYYVYGNSDCSVSWSYTPLSGTLPSLIPNSSNYSCTVNTSSSFTGYLNATITCYGCSVTYSRYITGTASPSSNGNDVMQVVPLDGSHYQISIGGEFEDYSIRVYDASNLQNKVTERRANENYVLDVTSWKRGLYIVEIVIGNKTYITKITKK